MSHEDDYQNFNPRFVKVLYDYNYNDTDSGDEVYMHVDEKFFLLDETNDEWWEVCRQKGGIPFFVPAQYVAIIEENKDENCNTEEHLKSVLTTDIDAVECVSDSHVEKEETQNAPPIIKDEPEVTYANLDEFRAAANIPQPGKDVQSQPPTRLNIAEDESPTGEYANLTFIQASIHPPSPEQGDYLQVLLEPLPWDIYKDRYSGRLFYHNRETNECMWKPPRKSKSPATPPPEKFGETKADPKLQTSVSSDVSVEYDITTENGDVIYTHKTSKEKWKKTSLEDHKEYFISLAKGEKVRELPTRLDKNVSFTLTVDEPANGDVTSVGTFMSTASLPRSSKSMSLYGNESGSNFIQNLEQQLSKSKTLPPNFSPDLSTPAPSIFPAVTSNSTDKPAAGMVKSASSHQTTSAYRSEPSKCLAGYLQTSRLSEVGKKVKKNWGQAYLALKQSNLVFYKDEKASTQKQPGSPHGKTELVINLQGAKIDINPKDITSKKNVILLVASNGSRFLLQSDEETIYRWLTEMKLVSGDLEAEQTRSSVKEDKKGMTRSLSTEDNGRNLWNIRSKLLGLMRSRPAQEDLVKRGIIKDSVFGSRLKELCEKEHVKVPKFVCLCVTAVEKRGLHHDGIYRISGNLAEIQRLRYVVDKDDTYDLDDKQWDFNVLTGALKLFFRELKESLIPPDMFDRFSAAVRKDSYKDKLKSMKDVIHDLPRCVYETIKFLFQHLTKVVKDSKKNRMQAHNLAIVFGPTLSWKDDADASNLAVLTIYQSRIVEFMLLEFDNLFK